MYVHINLQKDRSSGIDVSQNEKHHSYLPNRMSETKVSINKLTHVVVNCGYADRLLDVDEDDLDDMSSCDDEDLTDDLSHTERAVRFLSNKGCEFIYHQGTLIPISKECRELKGGPLVEFIKKHFTTPTYSSYIVFREDSLYTAIQTVDGLIQARHCGCFGHANLFEITTVQNDEYKVIGLSYDTESG